MDKNIPTDNTPEIDQTELDHYQTVDMKDVKLVGVSSGAYNTQRLEPDHWNGVGATDDLASAPSKSMQAGVYQFTGEQPAAKVSAPIIPKEQPNPTHNDSSSRKL